MSVGLMLRSVVKRPLASTVNLVSKNETGFEDHSAVNLIEGWNSFIDFNAFKRSLPCSQMAKMSSMYLHHVEGTCVFCP